MKPSAQRTVHLDRGGKRVVSTRATGRTPFIVSLRREIRGGCRDENGELLKTVPCLDSYAGCRSRMVDFEDTAQCRKNPI